MAEFFADAFMKRGLASLVPLEKPGLLFGQMKLVGYYNG
jgi:hypothetical protein